MSEMLSQICAVCSGCIRNNLEFQERKGPAKCPACREKCDARDLRPNHALKDLVQGYLQTRKLLVIAASALDASTPDAAQVSLNLCLPTDRTAALLSYLKCASICGLGL